VGKIEAGIPEDDPRNPGVIADNVGDNVGDVAGMGSDIFESYCGSMIASIAIAYTLGSKEMMMFPLALTSIGLIASIIGIIIVKLQSAKAPCKCFTIRNSIGAGNIYCNGIFFNN
jgi:K(+)-stimulated pyrophosphate-energized sodium pump